MDVVPFFVPFFIVRGFISFRTGVGFKSGNLKGFRIIGDLGEKRGVRPVCFRLHSDAVAFFARDEFFGLVFRDERFNFSPHSLIDIGKKVSVLIRFHNHFFSTDQEFIFEIESREILLRFNKLNMFRHVFYNRQSADAGKKQADESIAHYDFALIGFDAEFRGETLKRGREHVHDQN